jgi:hypothetical protein
MQGYSVPVRETIVCAPRVNSDVVVNSVSDRVSYHLSNHAPDPVIPPPFVKQGHGPRVTTAGLFIQADYLSYFTFIPLLHITPGILAWPRGRTRISLLAS